MTRAVAGAEGTAAGSGIGSCSPAVSPLDKLLGFMSYANGEEQPRTTIVVLGCSLPFASSIGPRRLVSPAYGTNLSTGASGTPGGLRLVALPPKT